MARKQKKHSSGNASDKLPLRIADRLLLQRRNSLRDGIVPLMPASVYDVPAHDKALQRNATLPDGFHLANEEIRRMPEDVTVLLADDVDAYRRDTGAFVKLEEYVNVIMPGPIVLVEVSTVLKPDGSQYPSSGSIQWGVWLREYPVAKLLADDNDMRELLHLSGKEDDVGSALLGTACMVLPGRQYANLTEPQVGLLLDEHNNAWHRVVQPPALPHIASYHNDAEVRDAVDSMENGAVSVIHTAFAALSLLNTRGVEAIDVTDTVGRSAKWHRRTRTPKVRYKVLDVDGDRQIVKRLAQKPGGARVTARHSVRRHRKIYTPEKPHVSGFVGAMMVNKHMRGSTKAGSVKKDYRPIPVKG